MCDQVPKVAWYSTQREALGLEAAVYAFMAVGRSTLLLFLDPFLSAGIAANPRRIEANSAMYLRYIALSAPIRRAFAVMPADSLKTILSSALPASNATLLHRWL